MKYKILEIYNSRVDERIKRKKFVIERGLLDLKYFTITIYIYCYILYV